MKRIYLLMALFGFGVNLCLIFSSYLLSDGGSFYAPSGLGGWFVAEYYLYSLTFFVIFIAAAAMRLKKLHAGNPVKWFGLSLLSFSVGSILGSVAFLLLIGLVWRSMSPVL